MRFLPFFFLLPVVAVAQVPQVSPVEEAMQQKIIQLESEALSWHAQAIAAQRQVTDFQKQLDATKAAKPTETK